jgi:hypothetical protein
MGKDIKIYGGQAERSEERMSILLSIERQGRWQLFPFRLQTSSLPELS